MTFPEVSDWSVGFSLDAVNIAQEVNIPPSLPFVLSFFLPSFLPSFIFFVSSFLSLSVLSHALHSLNWFFHHALSPSQVNMNARHAVAHFGSGTWATAKYRMAVGFTTKPAPFSKDTKIVYFFPRYILINRIQHLPLALMQREPMTLAKVFTHTSFSFFYFFPTFLSLSSLDSLIFFTISPSLPHSRPSFQAAQMHEVARKEDQKAKAVHSRPKNRVTEANAKQWRPFHLPFSRAAENFAITLGRRYHESPQVCGT